MEQVISVNCAVLARLSQVCPGIGEPKVVDSRSGGGGNKSEDGASAPGMASPIRFAVEFGCILGLGYL